MTLRQQVFLSPGTWTMPSSVTSVNVFLVGAGGGARNSPLPTPTPVPGYGGGGGIRWVYGVPVTGPVPVTVGAGAPGATGGSSSFGPTATVGGGGRAFSSAPSTGGSAGQAYPDTYATPYAQVSPGSYGNSLGGGHYSQWNSRPDGFCGNNGSGFGTPRSGTLAGNRGTGEASTYSPAPSGGSPGLVVVSWFE